MKLIDNWKQAWKLKSVQVGAISAFFYALILFSEQFVQVWNIIPQDLKNYIPAQWQEYVGCFVGVAMILARLKKQPELYNVNQFVTVTAGHSNTDPGAVNGKLKESDFVVIIRNALAYYLREAGVTVKTDGIGLQNDPLSSAIKLIKGSNVALEIHMNAAINKAAVGIETISLPKDKKLAQDISKAVQKITGSRLRGDNGWIDQSKSARGKLAFVSNGGLILEVGFISNDDESMLINSKAWLIAKEISKILIEYEGKA
ncbi:N-acetylmuramoyl-L-alanine amidase [Acinetobacter terrae]|uniref:N-acetylmuramoyl-L-alanine amidase n=1 Tax=Acinetobacter terrae TaxID=2731247 RepID=A0A4R0ELJ8_9GAMM|nr:N-acetylmuramoyl-L-alanine amidase [Acinetobacter terrae]TCB58632.1 N-acetylmuramoyl-L-alanine amidase [Acinetobacter terrae]